MYEGCNYQWRRKSKQSCLYSLHLVIIFMSLLFITSAVNKLQR